MRDAGIGPGAHDRRIDAGGRPGDDARQRRQTPALGLVGAHDDQRGGAVVEARGVAAVTVPSLEKAGLSFAIASKVDAGARIFVGVDDDVALAGRDRKGDDLVLEPAGLLRGLGLVLRADREPVLLLAGDLPLAGDVLGGVAHVIAMEGVDEPVLDHGVDELEVAHLHAGAQIAACGASDIDSWPPATMMLASPLGSAEGRARRRAGRCRRAD